MNKVISLQDSRRQKELDLIKFAAIIFMIFVHTYETLMDGLVTNNSVEYWLNYILEFLGGAPAAPVFMFCAGVGIDYSHRSTPSLLAKRGIKIFALGIIVNIFEDIFPLAWENPTMADLIEHIPSLFITDIYFYFGVTFLFIAFAIKTGKPKMVCLITIGLSMLYCLLVTPEMIAIENKPLAMLTGIFIGSNEESYFPFCSWIGYTLMGYLFGSVLKKTQDKDKLYKNCAIIATITLITVTIVGLALKQENSLLNTLECTNEAYYKPNLVSLIWGMSFIFIWILFAHFITKKLKNKTVPFILWTCKNVMSIYCIQWIAIFILMPLLWKITNIYVTYFACISVTALTFILTYFNSKLKSKIYKNK